MLIDAICDNWMQGKRSKLDSMQAGKDERQGQNKKARLVIFFIVEALLMVAIGLLLFLPLFSGWPKAIAIAIVYCAAAILPLVDAHFENRLRRKMLVNNAPDYLRAIRDQLAESEKDGSLPRAIVPAVLQLLETKIQAQEQRYAQLKERSFKILITGALFGIATFGANAFIQQGFDGAAVASIAVAASCVCVALYFMTDSFYYLYQRLCSVEVDLDTAQIVYGDLLIASSMANEMSPKYYSVLDGSSRK